jgi:hypothetical protein
MKTPAVQIMTDMTGAASLGKLTDFAKGLLIGFGVGLIIVGLTAALINRHWKNKELIEYVEKQQAIEIMREDYGNRDPVEFFEDPGVRGAADRATGDFERKRDEAVQRFRNRLID